MISSKKYIPKSAFFIKMLFVVLFLYTATSKFLDFQDFKVQIGKSPVLSLTADWLVWVVPLSELLVSAMLLVPRFHFLSLYASLVLMVGFTTYIILILYFTENIPCSCGGILESLGWEEHLIFNLSFVLMAVFAILISDYRLKKTRFD
ncbi:hypothetical protein PP182_17530 [Maribacter sp. PR1]|uniref:MauE/DoxX family redox-associated membrane protein n=1 Tax=Maribacter cobaltidurans TaxID=1178778 RepID=A0ABU7IY28_9FLAO|nr:MULTISPECIES: MauE/DoxX family redox-associated membrane protein [Maribacter]MDC6390495.1 hypothetical protein [Maribacter sp. PR1]MEE1977885.1 MauE/DoxX family redox-associated membrane protein [Maribacter cobaltidurans]